MTPEKRIQNAIISYLKSLENSKMPIFYERRQAGGFNYKMGIPDIYCVFNGSHIEIEVKTDNSDLRPAQIKFKLRCECNNILYVCARSVEDVKSLFREHFGQDFYFQ